MSYHKLMGLDGYVMIIWVACYRQESSIKILPSLPEWSLIHTSSTPTHPTLLCYRSQNPHAVRNQCNGAIVHHTHVS